MAASGPKVSLKWKVFLLVAFLITAALAVIIFRTNQIFYSDKDAFVKELSAKLTSSLSKNVSNKISALQDKLVIFISSKESLAHTGAKLENQLPVLFARYQDFVEVALLRPGENGLLQFDWSLRNPNGPATAWAPDYEKTFLATINGDKAIQSEQKLFLRSQGPNGQPLTILGFAVQIIDPKSKAQDPKSTPGAAVNAWIVGILPGQIFDDLLGDFATGLNTAVIVDHTGTAISHSDATMRWKSLANHPLVAEIMKKSRPAGAGDFTDVDGRNVVGSYEQIPKLNLSVAVTTPRDKAFEAAQVLMRNILFIGGVVLLIAIATAILLANYITGPLQKLRSIAAEIGAGNFKVPIDVTSNDEIGELADGFKKMEQGLLERDEALEAAQSSLIQSEKMSAFGQLSAGIAHEVKNPLAGILGHAQLAMGKIQSEDVRKHLEVIEKETRRCKQIVENLMKFARQEKAELKPTDLAQVCQDTINLVDHQISLAGCKIYKDFKPTPMVMANANQLQQVLLNLIVNASHAMEKSSMKNVTVRVVQAGNKAQIQIEDTGSGIPPEIQKKIFEPFFTTKPAGKGTGLGLSVSIGIVKEHKGEIYIKSVINQGTTFFIDFPIPEGAQISTKPLENTHGGQVSGTATSGQHYDLPKSGATNPSIPVPNKSAAGASAPTSGAKAPGASNGSKSSTELPPIPPVPSGTQSGVPPIPSGTQPGLGVPSTTQSGIPKAPAAAANPAMFEEEFAVKPAAALPKTEISIGEDPDKTTLGNIEAPLPVMSQGAAPIPSQGMETNTSTGAMKTVNVTHPGVEGTSGFKVKINRPKLKG